MLGFRISRTAWRSYHVGLRSSSSATLHALHRAQSSTVSNGGRLRIVRPPACCLRRAGRARGDQQRAIWAGSCIENACTPQSRCPAGHSRKRAEAVLAWPSHNLQSYADTASARVCPLCRYATVKVSSRAVKGDKDTYEHLADLAKELLKKNKVSGGVYAAACVAHVLQLVVNICAAAVQSPVTQCS